MIQVSNILINFAPKLKYNKHMTLTMHSEVVVTLTKHGADILNKRNQELWDKYKDDPKVKLYGYTELITKKETHIMTCCGKSWLSSEVINVSMAQMFHSMN